ncbi:MAG: MGMT family protein [Armatimonadetes bacterium]|nr:MGMT family protein [Armatimonadota bacterium]
MLSNALAHLIEQVNKIPRGRVASYGMVGRSLRNPVSGLVVGRWMASLEDGDALPWWRVIGADGRLPIEKRGPHAAQIQRDRLEEEGVGFVEGKVEKIYFVEREFLLD